MYKKEVFLFLIFLYCCNISAVTEVHPKVILKFPKYWKNIALPNSHKLAYYGVPENRFLRAVVILCSAPFPIQWNITGYPYEDFWRIGSLRKDDNLFVIRAYADPTVFQYVDNSLRFGCEKANEPDRSDEIYIFSGGFGNHIFIRKTSKIVNNSNVIPCATTDPSIEVQLYLKGSNNTKKLVGDFDKSLSYNPVEGFRSDYIFDGIYECQQSSYSVSFQADTSKWEENEYGFDPVESLIRAFSENSLQVECNSKSGKSVHIVSDSDKLQILSNGTFDEQNLHANYFTNGQNVSIVYTTHVNKTIAKISVSSDISEIVEGKVMCVRQSEETKEVTVLKEWKFQFLPTPNLRMDNYVREISCMALIDKTHRELKTFKCRDRMMCTIQMAHCANKFLEWDDQTLDVVYKNNTLKTNKRVINDKTGLLFLDSNEIRTPYLYTNGIVQCSVNGLVKEWKFFESLNRQKYLDTNWKNVPTKDLIRMDDIPTRLYTNETNQFFCEAVVYLFGEQIEFIMELKNKSRLILKENGNSVNITIHTDGRSRIIKDLNVIAVLDIKLPPKAVAIECVGYLWRPIPEVVKDTRRFKTFHIFSNRFGTDNTTTILPVQETFYMGDKTRRLACPSDGESEDTWYFNGTEVTDYFPEFKISVGTDGESYLEFPEITSLNRLNLEGEYVCKIGGVEQIFNVKISDKEVDGIDVLYVSLGIVAIIVIIILISFLSISILKSQQNRKNLTETEVEEFFNGRPDLLVSEANPDTIDYLPYDKNYEIPLDDLHFVFSEKTLLGSGEFAFVLRGLIKSKGQVVALKISKPSADVALFKSMLSEVKIMAYIGQHENVVELIGVCTASIQARSIYICTAICELGSLNSFLRKSKSSFVNLLEDNDEYDMILRETNSQELQLTSLDLIYFCAQIAKGMDYLASKSVIHADLATRNVLLTGSKIAKISDFGLSKKLYGDINYVKKSRAPLPWRWMALESLKTLTFSTKSDVWAYGVTLYEIFTLGDTPFSNEICNDGFKRRMEDGMRLERPSFSSLLIYSKMLTCWENEPELRPDFGSLHIFFEELYMNHSQSMTQDDTISLNTIGSHEASFLELV